MIQSSVQQADILIVDDTPENLRLLSSMLEEQSYKVRKATNGKQALKAIEAQSPDLILLDILMPEMNGYQIAKHLKSLDSTRDIPIIFLSALNDTMDKVFAFDVGGVDYITKPFQVQEVLVRVRTQITLRNQQKQLREQNQKLQQEIKERQKIESALRVYIHAVSHDLRNPVTGMLMILNNLLSKKSSDSPSSLTVNTNILEQMANSCDRQLNLLNSLVETSDTDLQGISLNCQPLDLVTFTQQLITEWQPIFDKNKVGLNHTLPSSLPQVQADSTQLWRVFDNLFSNAIKYNIPGLSLTLSTEIISDKKAKIKSCNQWIKYTISDNGVGINPEESEKLFELYKRGKNVGKIKGLGLGLYLCRQIINGHGGEIGVIPSNNSGVSFWFTLPVLPSKKS
ncbi:hybrid sensor histidine kinase/response regulator [Lyngbya sp. PCC 8106]|uniref:hybrid sensor histidine kinase/response regulator n=1 Tax=Lyngbya sp. (strain PCC 8106) TaxID=313612 RepID=UPI0000EADB48|nr:hybrid sensor histidine kinase/response regulator [Lyngbya sp. PCC 8106]EAW36445.1 hybrid sensory kinase [Lyngbya sp. PCC 8106]